MRTARREFNISWIAVILTVTARVIVSIDKKRYTKKIYWRLRLAIPLNCALCPSRCIAQKVMVGGEYIPRSIYAIINGGAKATVSICAAERDHLHRADLEASWGRSV